MREKLTEYLPLTTVFMLGAALLTYHLGHWSFWFDESFTSTLIKYDFSEIAGRTANDVHPPLFYYLLKVWSGLFGATDAALRSFSAILMMFATFSLYKLYRRISNYATATLAMLFAVVGPFVVRYGQEARMYALAATFLSVATLALYIQMNLTKRKRTTKMWLIYGFAIAAALYTHYFTFPIIFAHWLYVIYSDSKLEINRGMKLKKVVKTLKKLDLNWWKVNLFAFLLFLPWLPTFLSQAGRVNSGFWIPGVDHTTITDTFAQMFMYDSFTSEQGPARVVVGLAITIIAALALHFVWRRISREEQANLILLAGPAVITSVILFVYSIPPFTSSIYSVRYLASFSVLLYSSLGYLAWLVWKNISKRGAIIGALTLLSIMIAGTTQVVWGWGRDHFKANEGIGRLNQVLVEGDAIVAEGYWQQYDTHHYVNPAFTPQVKVEGNFYGGETLLIGRNDILIEDYARDVVTRTGTVWYVSGAEDSFDNLPSDWRVGQTLYFERDFKVTRMIVD